MPLQKPHPPLLFGGNGDGALRRVADLGDGWFGWSLEPEEVAERVARLGELLRERGREPSSARIVVGHFGTDLERDRVAAYEAAGVDELALCVLEDRENPDAVVEAARQAASKHIGG